jgi:hypothetical protein
LPELSPDKVQAFHFYPAAAEHLLFNHHTLSQQGRRCIAFVWVVRDPAVEKNKNFLVAGLPCIGVSLCTGSAVKTPLEQKVLLDLLKTHTSLSKDIFSLMALNVLTVSNSFSIAFVLFFIFNNFFW